MVFSGGFLDHAAEVYLRTNGLIMSAQPQQMSTLNRNGVEWSPQTPTVQLQQSQSQPQQTLPPYPQLQSCPTQAQVRQQIQTIMQDVKMNSTGKPAPARAMLLCHPNSHQFQVRIDSGAVDNANVNDFLCLRFAWTDAKYFAGTASRDQSRTIGATMSSGRDECNLRMQGSVAESCDHVVRRWEILPQSGS